MSRNKSSPYYFKMEVSKLDISFASNLSVTRLIDSKIGKPIVYKTTAITFLLFVVVSSKHTANFYFLSSLSFI